MYIIFYPKCKKCKYYFFSFVWILYWDELFLDFWNEFLKVGTVSHRNSRVNRVVLTICYKGIYSISSRSQIIWIWVGIKQIKQFSFQGIVPTISLMGLFEYFWKILFYQNLFYLSAKLNVRKISWCCRSIVKENQLLRAMLL